MAQKKEASFAAQIVGCTCILIVFLLPIVLYVAVLAGGVAGLIWGNMEGILKVLVLGFFIFLVGSMMKRAK